jgi:hypothetical protein
MKISGYYIVRCMRLSVCLCCCAEIYHCSHDPSRSGCTQYSIVYLLDRLGLHYPSPLSCSFPRPATLFGQRGKRSNRTEIVPAALHLDLVHFTTPTVTIRSFRLPHHAYSAQARDVKMRTECLVSQYPFKVGHAVQINHQTAPASQPCRGNDASLYPFQSKRKLVLATHK